MSAPSLSVRPIATFLVSEVGGVQMGLDETRGALSSWRLQILTALCDACDIVLHAFMRRSPCSRQDSAMSLRGELRHPTVLFRNVAEACCSIGNLVND